MILDMTVNCLIVGLITSRSLVGEEHEGESLSFVIGISSLVTFIAGPILGIVR